MHASKVRTMVGVAMLGAISFIVMFFEFPIILAFPFLKVDFSDVIVLLGTFIYGPLGGIGVAVIRSVLHFIMTGASLPSLVGDFAGVLASIFYLLPFYYLFKRQKSVVKGQIFAGVVSSISMTIVMVLANWLFILPLYIRLMGLNLGMSTLQYVLIGLVPFNLIKGGLVTVVFGILYLRILPWLKQHMKTAI
ncbi:ECF transporter S component [Latilactobacillus fuchuensis]|uniref:Riboflavin transporter n=2 Tax=Latilactobacillus fuchuensis TaxID=164393 RepID=A0A2N9DVL0_9LACO|nr:ECF transporter S component [Latilactobacillus fuchuensis]MCP8857653.1 ECF transporter S component [Latilactobacillus fuchuensis]SPC38558.1 putative riboflavin ECF transporter [Latilactobacillus fuchuensis]